APAYVTAGLFLLCGVLSLVIAIVSWDGTTDASSVLAAVIGILVSNDVTNNLDFGISVTMTVACTTLTFALIALARLDFMRWILGVLGAIVAAYYVFALIRLLSHDGASLIGLVIGALLLWLAATVTAFLPATGRAMRGAERRFAPQPPQPPQQAPPPQYYGR
ncbi:MAG TPA: hypothetical protein VGR06_00575, partial [Actinophytocola sp.]|uniref:hypothetical protein n=1 Tax=Actinophytocola sp. TaxID=1872138 RepID=UPI002DFD657F|nr:hypothetical protein [Actinophytocola sp.]